MPAADVRTLAIDCGGSGIKGAVLDSGGDMLTGRIRYRVRYPMTPDRFVDQLAAMAKELGDFDRATVGMPGMIRHGCVITTPHYRTKAGPHSAVDRKLAHAWSRFDVQGRLGEVWQRPVRVLNDAQVHGAAVISGQGFEVVFTLGTGLGCAMFDDGVLLPKLELSRAPVRKGVIYDEWVGNKARKTLGNKRWTARVRKAIAGLRPMFEWDQLYVGGGNAKHLHGSLGSDVVVVPNIVGIHGGVAVWTLREVSGEPS